MTTRKRPAKPRPPRPLHYTVGRWGQHINYTCVHCRFATLDRAAILEHVISKHGVPQPDQTQHNAHS